MTATETDLSVTGWPIAMIDVGERVGRNFDGLDSLTEGGARCLTY